MPVPFNPGRFIPQLSHYSHYAMPIPFKPRMVHQLAQSIHPLRYTGSIQTTDSPPPAQSIHPLRYVGSIQTPDGSSPSPINTPTMI
jgi:hypothetical protein